MVPCDVHAQEHDLTYRINGADIKAVIVTSAQDIADVVDNVMPECPSLNAHLGEPCGAGLTPAMPRKPRPRRRELAGEALSGPEGHLRGERRARGWEDFNAGVRAASETFERRETRASDPMLMYFSSGTSGNPKMVLHDSRYALAHLVTAKHWHNVRPDGLHFTIADTGWGKAVWGKYYGQWLMEAGVFTHDFDRFHASEILGLIAEHGITTLCCPPTMYRS